MPVIDTHTTMCATFPLPENLKCGSRATRDTFRLLDDTSDGARAPQRCNLPSRAPKARRAPPFPSSKTFPQTPQTRAPRAFRPHWHSPCRKSRAIVIAQTTHRQGETHETTQSPEVRLDVRRARPRGPVADVESTGRRYRSDQGRRPAFAVRHDGDLGDVAEGYGAHDHLRHQQERRRDGPQARAGRRRPGVELAAVRGKGAPAPHPGQGAPSCSAAGRRCRASRCCPSSRN